MGKGQQHNFLAFKDNPILLHPDALLLANSRYQGVHTMVILINESAGN
jgi:hypothetical protein